MKSKLLILLSLFAFVGGVKAQKVTVTDKNGNEKTSWTATYGTSKTFSSLSLTGGNGLSKGKYYVNIEDGYRITKFDVSAQGTNKVVGIVANAYVQAEGGNEAKQSGVNRKVQSAVKSTSRNLNTNQTYFEIWNSVNEITANITQITVWFKKTYNVTFKDGETTLSSYDDISGERITKPADPVKPGYAFAGWDNLPTDELVPEKDLVLVAKWTAKTEPNNTLSDWVGVGRQTSVGYHNNNGVETYNGNTAAFAAGDVLTQTLGGLANGYYEVSVYAWENFANHNNNANIPTGNDIAQVFANDDSQGIEVIRNTGGRDYDDANKYTLVAHVTDNTLKYGVKNIATGGNWAVCKPISVTYLGNDRANMKCSLGKFGTFVAPFEVEIPNGIKAYTVKGVENTVVQTSEVLGNILSANTPVIVENVREGENAEDLNIFVYGDKNQENLGAKLVGVYEDGEPIPVGAYVLQAKSDGIQKFYRVNTEGFTGTANRCYLWLGNNPVNAFSFNFDDVDAIEAIEALTSDKAQIFDLNGRKLDRLQKGINIVNGKKIMVK